jgi:ribosome-associated protein
MGQDVLQGRDFSPEFVFSASRSSGPGGQHVNKVSTRVELRFDLLQSALLTAGEKEIILTKIAGKVNKKGILILVSQTDRSQSRNKERTIEKFYSLIARTLKPRKKRKRTLPTHESIEDRLERKRRTSWKKVQRKNIQGG